MNALLQQESLLIGSKKAIEELERKNDVRLLVLSDTHGKYELTESIIREFGTECDAMIFCGDGLQDIVTFIDSAFDDEDLQNSLPPVVAFAQGNGDETNYSIYQDFDGTVKESLIKVPPLQLLKAGGRNVLCVHGHRNSVDIGTETLAICAHNLDADFVFFGHTHRPYWEENETTLILNPGSPSRPRGNFPPTFAIVSFPGATERFMVEYYTIENSIFGSYSFESFSISPQ